MSTGNASAPDAALSRAVKKFERAIVVALVAMMMVVVALSTVELAWTIARDIHHATDYPARGG